MNCVFIPKYYFDACILLLYLFIVCVQWKKTIWDTIHICTKKALTKSFFTISTCLCRISCVFAKSSVWIQATENICQHFWL